MIVVDASVLSIALRRRQPTQGSLPVAQAFQRFVEQDAPLVAPGVVLQEVLSGVRHETRFRKLRDSLGGYPILLAQEADHIRAAQISNACRRHGTQASTVDCLIAALTIRYAAQLWTLDEDFPRMARWCGLQLFRP